METVLEELLPQSSLGNDTGDDGASDPGTDEQDDECEEVAVLPARKASVTQVRLSAGDTWIRLGLDLTTTSLGSTQLSNTALQQVSIITMALYNTIYTLETVVVVNQIVWYGHHSSWSGRRQSLQHDKLR